MPTRSMLLFSPAKNGWLAAVLLCPWLTCLASAAGPTGGTAPTRSETSTAGAAGHLEQGESLRKSGRLAEALPRAEAALAAARARNDLTAEASAQTLRAGILEGLRRAEEAGAAWKEAERLYARIQDGPGQIRALLHQAYLQRDPAAVSGLLQRAVTLSERETRKPAEAALRLTEGGIAFDRRGDNRSALRLLEASLSLRRWLEPGSSEVASHLELVGNLSLRLGRVEAGERYHREGLFHRERISRTHPAVGSSLSNLALIELGRGRLPQARSLAERAVGVYERAMPESEGYAAALRVLAKVQLGQREPEAARRRLSRAIEMLDADPRRNNDLLAECLSLLCEAGQALSQPALAREQCRRLVEVVAAARPDSVQEARARRQLAGLLARLGEVSEARREYGRMLAILERADADPLDTSMSLLELALLDFNTNNPDAARIYLERAASIAGKAAPDSVEHGRILGALGLWAFRERDFNQARERFRQAFELFRRSVPGSREHVLSLVHQGWALERLNRLDEAEEAFREASRLQEGSPDQHGIRLMVEEALGILASHRGDLAQAERRARTVFTLIERYEASDARASTAMANLGGVLLRQGKATEAEPLLARAWALRQQEFSGSSNPEVLSRLAGDHQWMVASLVSARVQLGRPLEAFTTREQASGRALEALLFDRRYTESTVPQELRERLARATALREAAEAELAARSLELVRAEAAAGGRPTGSPPGAPGPSGDVEAVRARFNRARDAQILAREEVERIWEQVVAGAGSVSKRSVDQAAVRASLEHLREGEVFVAFQGVPDAMLVFVAQGRGGHPAQGAATVSPPPRSHRVKIECFRIPHGEGEIADRVFRFVDRVAAASGEAVPLGRALCDLLFPEPVRDKILTCRRLVLSPDGPLWELPFAALPFSSPTGAPSYLGLLKPISLTPSLVLSDRARRGTPRTSPRGRPVVLAVGDPVFDRAAKRLAANPGGERAFLFADGKPPSPLPGTREDARAVARLYGATPLLGERATEKAVRELMPMADVVHLATHGYLNPQWAMASGVLLTEPERAAGTNSAPSREDPRNDGALQAWEILSQLKLKAELVVLAACETGRGQHQRGEGLLGLTRALHVAGARSVVASQWKVRDDSTRELMTRLHEGIREGLDKDEALRRAMVRVQKRAGWSHPYYWAGFVLTGAVDNPTLGKPAVKAK